MDEDELRLPEDGEMFARVESMQGANRVEVRCADGERRTARIPGRMRKRVWIRDDDIVLVEPWDWQEERADVTWRYENRVADRLDEEGYLSL
ncbi:translation initiation factor eIF-1A [Halobacteriales archaeon QH_7_65_31]|nr:MAG: translation initiation factor eIF-1A [Halobacteriales archaeon QH_7_65_31]PSQ29868.1 MAG: translation initiation factor eIF-1A [Halobacteriales archaeon SW_6_65_46]